MDQSSSNGGGKATAAEIVPALKEQAAKLADQSVHSGVDAAAAVGKAAESAAQSLDEALPALAGYVRNAADYTNKFADSLRDKKAEDLLGTAVTWSKQQPLLTLAGAALLGFALSRVVKTGVLPTAGSAPNEGRIDVGGGIDEA
jgi:ABC-type transporter Mla subunit MlaD